MYQNISYYIFLLCMVVSYYFALQASHIQRNIFSAMVKLPSSCDNTIIAVDSISEAMFVGCTLMGNNYVLEISNDQQLQIVHPFEDYFAISAVALNCEKQLLYIANSNLLTKVSYGTNVIPPTQFNLTSICPILWSVTVALDGSVYVVCFVVIDTNNFRSQIIELHGSLQDGMQQLQIPAENSICTIVPVTLNTIYIASNSLYSFTVGRSSSTQVIASSGISVFASNAYPCHAVTEMVYHGNGNLYVACDSSAEVIYSINTITFHVDILNIPNCLAPQAMIAFETDALLIACIAGDWFTTATLFGFFDIVLFNISTGQSERILTGVPGALTTVKLIATQSTIYWPFNSYEYFQWHFNDANNISASIGEYNPNDQSDQKYLFNRSAHSTVNFYACSGASLAVTSYDCVGGLALSIQWSTGKNTTFAVDLSECPNQVVILPEVLEPSLRCQYYDMIQTCDTAGHNFRNCSATVKVSVLRSQGCEPGEYIYSPGVCRKCSPGHFSSVNNATECSQCKNGTFAPNQGQAKCIPCLAGSFSGMGAEKCDMCPMGTFSAYSGSSECSLCHSGSVTIANASVACYYCVNSLPLSGETTAYDFTMSVPSLHRQCCSVGYYPVDNYLACLACPVNTYYHVDSAGVVSCNACPKGLASGLASPDASYCFNPVPNFVSGTICIILAAVLFYKYLFHGRFFRISFLRKHRIVSACVKPCKQVVVALNKVLEAFQQSRRQESDHKKYNHSTWRSTLFTIGACITVAFGTCFLYLVAICQILFGSLITWKGIKKKLGFEFAVRDVAAFFDDILRSKVVTTILWPFTELMVLMSKIHIDLSKVKVTCAGSQAPVQLLMNFLIIGIVLVVIMSEFLLFWSTMFSTRVQDVITAGFQTRYHSVNHHKCHIFIFFITNVAVLGVAMVNPLQTIMRYGMSFVYLIQFASAQGEHETTKGCGAYDKALGVVATVLAYSLIAPTVYSLGCLLMPGCEVDCSVPIYKPVNPEDRDQNNNIYDNNSNNIRKSASNSAYDFFDHLQESSRTYYVAMCKATTQTQAKCHSAARLAAKSCSLFALDMLLARLCSCWMKIILQFLTHRSAQIVPVTATAHNESYSSINSPTHDDMEMMTSTSAGPPSPAPVGITLSMPSNPTMQNQASLGHLDMIWSMFRAPTDHEQQLWEEYRQNSMPSYMHLCQIASEELTASLYCHAANSRAKALISLFSNVLCYLGPGHICSSFARTCWWAILMKYMSFLVCCVGIWTDHALGQYDVTGIADELDEDRGSGSDNDNANDRRKVFNPGKPISSSELKKQRERYSAIFTGLICPRAILFQLEGRLAPLSAFVIFMAGTPLWIVKDDSGYAYDWICWDAFRIAKEREVEEISQSRCADSESSSSEHSESETVPNWVILLMGINIFVYESRFMLLLLNLYKFVLSVVVAGMISSHRYAAHLKPFFTVLMIASMAVLLPAAFAQSVVFVVYIGKRLRIQDAQWMKTRALSSVIGARLTALGIELPSKSRVTEIAGPYTVAGAECSRSSSGGRHVFCRAGDLVYLGAHLSEREVEVEIDVENETAPIITINNGTTEESQMEDGEHEPMLAHKKKKIRVVQLMTGRLGDDLSEAQGREAARLCAMNLLSTLRVACGGNLDRVQRIVKLSCSVQATESFSSHSAVLLGCSDLLLAVFGPAICVQAETVTGCHSLAGGASVQVDAVVRDERRRERKKSYQEEAIVVTVFLHGGLILLTWQSF